MTKILDCSKPPNQGSAVVLWIGCRYRPCSQILDGIQLFIDAQEIHFMKLHSTLRATQNLLHLPALRQLIHQLIQIPNLLRQRILDFLHTIPTDYAGDEVRIGV